MKRIVMAALLVAGCRPTPTLAEQGATPVSERGQIKEDGAEPNAGPMPEATGFFTGQMYVERDVKVLETRGPIFCTGLAGGDDKTVTCFHIEEHCSQFHDTIAAKLGAENITPCEAQPNGACFPSKSIIDGNARINCAPTMGSCIHQWAEERANTERSTIATCFVVRMKQ